MFSRSVRNTGFQGEKKAPSRNRSAASSLPSTSEISRHTNVLTVRRPSFSNIAGVPNSPNKSNISASASPKSEVYSRLNKANTKSHISTEAENRNESPSANVSIGKFTSRIPTLANHWKKQQSTVEDNKQDLLKESAMTPSIRKPRVPVQALQLQTGKTSVSVSLTKGRRGSTSSSMSTPGLRTPSRTIRAKRRKTEQPNDPNARLDEQIAQTLEQLLMNSRVSQTHSHILSPFSTLSLSNPKVSKRALFWIAQAIALGADLYSFFESRTSFSITKTMPQHESSMSLALDILLEGSEVLRRNKRRTPSSPKLPNTPNSRFHPSVSSQSAMEEGEKLQEEIEIGQRRLLDEAIGVLAPMINKWKSPSVVQHTPTFQEPMSTPTTTHQENHSNSDGSPQDVDMDATEDVLPEEHSTLSCMEEATEPDLPPLVDGATTMILSPLLPSSTPASRVTVFSQDSDISKFCTSPKTVHRSLETHKDSEQEAFHAQNPIWEAVHDTESAHSGSVKEVPNGVVTNVHENMPLRLSIHAPTISTANRDENDLLSPNTTATLEKYRPTVGMGSTMFSTFISKAATNPSSKEGTFHDIHSKSKVFSVFPETLMSSSANNDNFNDVPLELRTPKSVQYAHMTPPPSLSNSMIQGHIYGDSAFKTGKGLNLTNCSLSPFGSTHKTRMVLPFNSRDSSFNSIVQSPYTSQMSQNYAETRAYLASRRLNLDNTPPSSPNSVHNVTTTLDKSSQSGNAEEKQITSTKKLVLPPTPESITTLHLPSTITYSAIRPRRPANTCTEGVFSKSMDGWVDKEEHSDPSNKQSQTQVRDSPAIDPTDTLQYAPLELDSDTVTHENHILETPMGSDSTETCTQRPDLKLSSISPCTPPFPPPTRTMSTPNSTTNASLDQSLGSVVVFQTLPLRPKAAEELGSPQILSPVRRASRLYRRSILNELGPLSPTLAPPTTTPTSSPSPFKLSSASKTTTTTSTSRKKMSKQKARTPHIPLPGVAVPQHVTFEKEEKNAADFVGISQRLFLDTYEDDSSLSIVSHLSFEEKLEDASEEGGEMKKDTNNGNVLAGQDPIPNVSGLTKQFRPDEDILAVQEVIGENASGGPCSRTTTIVLGGNTKEHENRSSRLHTLPLIFMNSVLRESMKNVLQDFKSRHKAIQSQFPPSHPIHTLFTLSVTTAYEPITYPMDMLPMHLLPAEYVPKDVALVDNEPQSVGQKRSRRGGSCANTAIDRDMNTTRINTSGMHDSDTEETVICPFVRYGQYFVEQFNLNMMENNSLPLCDLQSVGLFAAYATSTIAEEFFSGVSLHIQATTAPIPTHTLLDTMYTFALNPALPEHTLESLSNSHID